jgi:hypothetical protein
MRTGRYLLDLIAMGKQLFMLENNQQLQSRGIEQIQDCRIATIFR